MSFFEQIKGIFGVYNIDTNRAASLARAGAILLDVRSPQEFDSGSIQNARNIPVGGLKAQLNTLAKDLPIVAYCHSGARSGMAVATLRSAGFEAYNAGAMARLSEIKWPKPSR